MHASGTDPPFQSASTAASDPCNGPARQRTSDVPISASSTGPSFHRAGREHTLSGFQAGMAEGLRDQRDRCAVVERMRRMAWRSQCVDAAGFTPARRAAALTMYRTARSVSGLPSRRGEGNTGVDGGASPRLASSLFAISAGINTWRTLSPLPTISS